MIRWVQQKKKLSCFRVIPRTKALKIHYKSWREREKRSGDSLSFKVASVTLDFKHAKFFRPFN